MTPLRILFLTDNFPPEVNAPASRTHEHCRYWVNEGHDVTVVTCAPNFPKGRVFDGYRNRLWQEEIIDGIRVIRVWSYITANEGFLRRVLDYLSFMISGSLAALFVPRVDVVIGTSPQFFTVCAAWLVAAVRRKPFVFELRDLWPESIKAVGAMRDSLAIRMLERIETFLYRRATRIVSVTHSFKKHLAASGIDLSKVVVVTNGADLSRFTPRPKDEALASQLGLNGKFVAGYVGTHGMAHALETLLDAARLLQTMPGGGDVQILFLGDGARKTELIKQSKAMELHNVTFLDSVSKDQVPRYWSLLDASIIHLNRSELFTTVIPSKLFECMAMGIPVLHGVSGESADIVRNEGAGLVFEPQNAEQLAIAILRLQGDAKLRADCARLGLAASGKYARSALAKRMLESLQALERC